VLGNKIAQYNIALNFYEKDMLGFSLFWCEMAKKMDIQKPWSWRVE